VSQPVLPEGADDSELRACAERVIDLIHLLMRTRPNAIAEIERSVLAIVTNDVRRQIAERVQRFSAEDVRLVEAVTEHLDQRLNKPGDANK
jgi:hypothetical protein